MTHDDDDPREVEREIRDALRLEPFFAPGVNPLIKVLEIGKGFPSARGVEGYVTLERYIVGLRPNEIEGVLGMEGKSLSQGCRVFRLSRRPGPSQVAYELTTKYPDGLAYTTSSDPKYPASSVGYVHQWRLLTKIPVVFLTHLSPDEPYRGS